jgi:hypothetical protein
LTPGKIIRPRVRKTTGAPDPEVFINRLKMWTLEERQKIYEKELRKTIDKRARKEKKSMTGQIKIN